MQVLILEAGGDAAAELMALSRLLVENSESMHVIVRNIGRRRPCQRARTTAADF